ncbi:MAG TPA: DUF6069 family protein [Acidimicrobiia bacterium]|jgi:hypothetical protein
MTTTTTLSLTPDTTVDRTTDRTTEHTTERPRTTSLVRTGAVAAISAAAAASLTAAIEYAAGVRFVLSGKAIPFAGFAEVTVMAVAIGTAIAAVIARRARRPHHTFVMTTLALTALSFVPDVMADAHAMTRVSLVLTHIAAALVAIPLLASRLSD